MPFGSASLEGSSGENISHFASIRIRVAGTGRLLMQVFSFDDVKYKVMVPFQLLMQNRAIPFRIVNFKEHRAAFELKTVGTNEYFRIHRIVIFIKESDTMRPGIS
jgi:hypothetical protein